MDIFEGAKLKVERAGVHISDVEMLVADFAKSDLHKLKTRQNPTSGFSVIVFETSDSLSTLVNLATGDAVHNLRAALDYAMTAVVGYLDHDIDIGRTSFPLRESRKEVVDFLNAPLLKKAMGTNIGKLVYDIFLNQIQPYGGFDKPIRMLGKMDNIDKHRLLITLFTMSGMSGSGRIGGMLLSGCTLMSYRGTPVVTSPGVSITGNFKPAVEIRINEAELPPYVPLIPALNNMVRAVNDVIDLFEQSVLNNPL